uniref:Sodium channel regulatory subunit beta-1 n=1 Tax=Cyclopterus lumpus TaxID=8103 RepID=A0A8C3G1X0_CYCLU
PSIYSCSVVAFLRLTLFKVSTWSTLCRGACVEVDSNTEAVADEGFKLGCISCKRRGEVKATMVTAKNQDGLFIYQNGRADIIDSRFSDRLHWNGSKKTDDLQDGSILILNVTFNDSGTYMCTFNPHRHHISDCMSLSVSLVTRGLASILSEVMMYVSIIGLQVWLVIEMIYCYRKISAAGEEALRESAAEYLAIASESKDHCAGVQVAE